MTTSSDLTYRSEIDGLRAVAVLSVILFHGGVPGFVGGYVGVDVFFVISGFLITSIISKEMREDRFSLVTFYERRARRILPALFLVILVSTPFAMALMLPYQLRDFGESIVAAILFVPNVLFYLESDYFSPDASLKPLLHTWSLGVEEQFYVLYPLFLLLVHRVAPRLLVAALVLGIVGSFAVAEIGWRISRPAAFYLTPTRAWELFAGALVALTANPVPGYGRSSHRRAGGAAALLGLGLIVGSVALLSERYPYPSAYTLPPVIGTVLVIAYAREGTLAARLLSLPLLVGIGLVSYSAYLWHQPVFAFAKLGLGEHPGIALAGGLIALSLGLAVLSYRFVEAPFRNRRTGPSQAQIFGMSGAGGLALIAAGVALAVTDGLVYRYPSDTRALASVNPTEFGDYTNSGFKSVRDARFDADSATPNVLLIGDSYAQDFINAAFENDYMADASISAINIPAPCGIVMIPGGHDALIEPADRARCSSIDDLYEAGDRFAAADLVILAASWRAWVIEHLPETIEAIEKVSDARVLVVNRKAFGPVEMRELLSLDPDTRHAAHNEMRPDVADLNMRLARAVEDSRLIDVPELYCGNATRCPVFTLHGRLISYDGWHLTPEGARDVGRALFKHPALDALR